MPALDALHDARLSGVVQAMTMLRAEVVAALATFTPDARKRRRDERWPRLPESTT
jgi:hypothetical protein